MWDSNHLCHSHLLVPSITGIIVKLEACYLAIKILILHYCAIINSHYCKVNECRFIVSVININVSLSGEVITKFHQSTYGCLSDIKSTKTGGSTGLTHCSLVIVALPHLPMEINARHFADDIFWCIFVNEKFCILIKFSLKFVPNGPIDNNPALLQIMAWRRIGDKPFSEPMLTDSLTCICGTRGRWVKSLTESKLT